MLSPLVALLLPVGFHLSSRAHLPQSSQSATCRSRTPLAQYPGEEAAKAAWLAKTAPDWAVGRVASTSAAPYEAPAPAAGPLIPGAPILTLEAADEMTNVALREAAARGFNPVSVIVVNAAGQMLVHKTMLGTPSIFPEFAKEKANLCIGMGVPSRTPPEKYVNAEGIGPKMPQMLAMSLGAAAGNQPIAPFPGGILVRDAHNNIVGAIAVSGAASDEDEHCAITGAHAVGLTNTEPPFSRLA